MNEHKMYHEHASLCTFLENGQYRTCVHDDTRNVLCKNGFHLQPKFFQNWLHHLDVFQSHRNSCRQYKR